MSRNGQKIIDGLKSALDAAKCAHANAKTVRWRSDRKVRECPDCGARITEFR